MATKSYAGAGRPFAGKNFVDPLYKKKPTAAKNAVKSAVKAPVKKATLSVPTKSVQKTMGATLQGSYANPQRQVYGGGGTKGIQAQGKLPAYKKGGMVAKTGPAIVHKGERVLTKKQASKFNAKKYEATRKSVFGLGKSKK